jgi:tripartite ATP-independent transporter DctM subunit
MPVIILGGIYGGVFTPTEASVVAVFYALIIGLFIHRELRWADLLAVLRKSVISSAVIMFIIANAGLFAFLITRAGIPEAIGLWLKDILQSPGWFLFGVNAALFVIGMFIETSAAIIVLAPILVPVAMHFGIDPVHFGIIMVVNLALGMITPPFGVNLFAACTVAKISLDRIIGHLLPFVLVIIGCLMVITYVPSISLALRDAVFAKPPAVVAPEPVIGPAAAPAQPAANATPSPSPEPAIGPSAVIGPSPAPAIGPAPVIGPSPAPVIGPSPAPVIGPSPAPSR